MYFLKLIYCVKHYNVYNNSIKKSSSWSLTYKCFKAHRRSIIYLRSKNKYVAGSFIETTYAVFNPGASYLFLLSSYHHCIAIFEEANNIFVTVMYYLICFYFVSVCWINIRYVPKFHWNKFSSLYFQYFISDDAGLHDHSQRMNWWPLEFSLQRQWFRRYKSMKRILQVIFLDHKQK